MTPAITQRGLACWLAAHVALTLVAGHQALGVVGMPFAGILVDPWARVSNVSLPDWNLEAAGLAYPHRVAAVDADEIHHLPVDAVPPAHAFYAALRNADARGATVVALRAEGPGGTRMTTRRVERITTEDAGFFFGLYALTGLLILVSGAAILKIGGVRPATVAFATWCAATHVMFTTFFAFHTGTSLYLLFPFGVVGFQFGLFWLALVFPTPAAFAGRALGPLMSVAAVLLLLAAGAISFAPWIGWDPSNLQGGLSFGVAASLAAPVFSVALRWRHADPEVRTQARTVMLGLAALPTLGSLAALGTALSATTAYHVVAPFMIVAVPMAMGYALVRHDVLGANSVLTQRVLSIPTVLLAAVLACGTWLTIRVVMGPDNGAFAEITSGAVLAGVALASQAALRAWLFPAAAHFRPTIEQLADELVDQSTPEAIARAVESAVRRWLPARHVQVLTAGELGALEDTGPGVLEKVRGGEQAWTGDGAARRLVIPMRSQDSLRGAMVLSPKRGGALFTDEDVALLETMAGLGAIAFHNAQVVADVNQLRRTEVDLSRGEKTLALGLLGAQVAHEVAHPLNFFRGLIEDLVRERTPRRDDVDTAREEIDRLERMLGSLRRLQAPLVRMTRLALGPVVRRAGDVVRDLAAERGIAVQLDVEEDAHAVADADPLMQVLSNLLRNAVQHAQARAGIQVITVDQRVVRLEVWNDGPAITAEQEAHLFHPWFTTRQEGTGLGLNIAVDLVRKLGWTIEHARLQERTVFVITVPEGAPA